MGVTMKRFLRGALRRHAAARAPGARMLAETALFYRQFYEGGGPGIANNGEAEIVTRLSGAHSLEVVFDVGANVGAYSTMVLDVSPRAELHVFEIAPPTYAKLSARLANRSNIRLNPFGLADDAGEMEIDYFPGRDTVSSMVKGVAGGIHDDPAQPLKVLVKTGDFYCEQHGVTKIDLLKIDVEGAEHLVLKGFENMMKERRISVIQFEYGLANIYTHHLLLDYHRYFDERGYKLGKLRARGVEFRDYHPLQEDFLGPNFVAVRGDRSDLIGALQDNA
jgi:FkbM family methyltransferase